MCSETDPLIDPVVFILASSYISMYCVYRDIKFLTCQLFLALILAIRLLMRFFRSNVWWLLIFSWPPSTSRLSPGDAPGGRYRILMDWVSKVLGFSTTAKTWLSLDSNRSMTHILLLSKQANIASICYHPYRAHLVGAVYAHVMVIESFDYFGVGVVVAVVGP